MPDRQLYIAHFDHGLRSDSQEDAVLIRRLAKRHGVPFLLEQGRLSSQSEAAAREARYIFLHEVMNEVGAERIVTAHHRDDVVETMIINLLRGTGWRGLASLRSTDAILRPLLPITRLQIERYAKAKRLKWREDSTNQDRTYLRNRIRQSLGQRSSTNSRQLDELYALYEEQTRLRDMTEQELSELINCYVSQTSKGFTIRRNFIIMLPNQVGLEILRELITRLPGRQNLTINGLKKLLIFAKTAKPGSYTHLSKDIHLSVSSDGVSLYRPL